ncbi:MAG: hypothetical protein RLO06_14810 [Parvibaculum sp.]
MIDLDRTRDPEVLRQVAKIQDAELRRVQQQMLALKRENEALKGGTPDEIAERMAEFERQLTQGYTSTYSSGSERRPRGTPPKKAKKPQKGHGPTPQPELPQQVRLPDATGRRKMVRFTGLAAEDARRLREQVRGTRSANRVGDLRPL